MNCVLNLLVGFVEGNIFTPANMTKMEPLTNQELYENKYTEIPVYIDRQTYDRLKEYHVSNKMLCKDLYRNDNIVAGVISDGEYFIKSFMNGECKEFAKEEFLDILREVKGKEGIGFAILVPKHITMI